MGLVEQGRRSFDTILIKPCLTEKTEADKTNENLIPILQKEQEV